MKPFAMKPMKPIANQRIPVYNDRIVTIAASNKKACGYPSVFPFSPDEHYPELGTVDLGNEPNAIYPLCRALFSEMRLDIVHFGTPAWNPLGSMIQPGAQVLVKPNLVRHIHLSGGDYQAVVTHGSLIRCVLDYIGIALDGRGEITVGDAPVQSGDFEELSRKIGLKEVCERISNVWKVPVRLVDFRLWAVSLDREHKMVASGSRGGDPKGYCSVDLGKRSLLAPIGHQCDRFRVTNYDNSTMSTHHNSNTNRYLVPRSVLDADVVINLPKLKTHRKVGMTAALKNLVGINGYKDWLPHHRCGSLEEGGDQYQSRSMLKEVKSFLIEKIDKDPLSKVNVMYRKGVRITERLEKTFGVDTYDEGSWHGNDTLWRTVLDLNRLLLYADKEGIMREATQRNLLNIVDAVIAGDGEGPMEPDARNCGLLVAGTNPVAVDAVLATIAGFDYRKIPLIRNAFSVDDWALTHFQPEKIEIRSNVPRWRSICVNEPCNEFRFRPPSGWVGNIEAAGQYVCETNTESS